ncbi:MAG: Pyruvate ferredoxin/flavodoxin oxidoreductase, beta subunit [Candidatus Pacebacteria bacterium GW2011_GWF2_38_9]|nr:MAG: pyruvate ferredoxin/flavodoxin oxidoreductase subunit beta, 2-oxoglutarate ferredoxin oxidoreductase subunit beta [candidate division TM6 bacterium GW2011_GWF2_28_16]KKQ89009.1 MAG: Pyruvate ferredoxin/flavodoxin oxidoreductase, beta subunit [Candidatus Pacebacteria bacterium GW2011_GWF2_38_9]HAZ73185.1 2-oxoacid ferredoxin oxidoreductase [Candidatus Paceibacterota bacterium]
MTEITLDKLLSPMQPTWCPGCGNFSILTALKQALVELGLSMEEVVIVFGIGCSGNTADFIKCYGLHGLHGRGMANAIGIKLANHKQKVIMIGGDGDIYGEGLNHLVAACRGNHDITTLVFNNHRYSLTTGQSSPTSAQGTVSKSTPQGLIETPLLALNIAIGNGAGFVARAYAGKLKQMVELIKAGILYEGFSLIDVQQPCPSFNKEQDYAWYQENVFDLDEAYDPSNQAQAMTDILNSQKLSLGILYQNNNRSAYHKGIPQLNEKTLIEQFPNKVDLTKAIKEFI